MKLYKYVPALPFLLLGTNLAFAADENGYTAQYECRAGGPVCNVDVVALGNRACDQTVSASTPWSSVNWSNNTICLEPGDHTWKGTLTLQAGGRAGAPKVLRYYRAGDSNDEPWNQSGNQARIYAINTNGSDHWLIHRLTVDPAMGQTVGVWVGHGTTNVILNRMYITRTDGKGVQFIGSPNTSDTNNNTIQNSVVAHMKTRTDAQENDCIGNSWATNTRIVNNELFDCNKSTSTSGSYALSAGIVAENNDMWDSRRTDCNGNDSATGECGRTEAFVSWKSGGTAENPAKLLHNRMFGGRHTDGALAQAGDFIAISLSAEFNDPAGASYVLVQNNIVTESEGGIVNYYGGPDHNSVVGNILYGIHRSPRFGATTMFGTCLYYRGLNQGGSGSFNNNEFYLNTCIDADRWLGMVEGNDNDVRCNVAISTGAVAGSPSSGTQADHNAYYDAGNAGEPNKITNSVSTRANSVGYTAGAIVRWSDKANCKNSSDSACFLYKATTSGTTDASSPLPCTALGCTFSDGGVTWQAIRGPYTYYRKLKTGPEAYTIPYARVHAAAPEAYACPADYSSRAGIGIN